MKQHDVVIPFCEKCALETNSIFKHLSHDEAIKLNYEKDFRHYKKGDVLYHEGNRISGFYCINSGIIKVYKTGLDGKEQIMERRVGKHDTKIWIRRSYRICNIGLRIAVY